MKTWAGVPALLSISFTPKVQKPIFNFVSAATYGDVIEIGLKTTGFGRTSVTMQCEVRNKDTKHKILTIEKIVFVLLDEEGKPKAHGVTMPE